MSTRFSAALREATWAEHERAESAGFMRGLLAGDLPSGAYADLTAQHYFAYRVLEQAAESMRGDPVAGPFVFDELTRLPALERDLHHLLGDDWADRIRPNTATQRYCARLQEVCFTWPGGFIAHSYTRYLGDLSGGQAIRGTVERTFGLTDGVGAEFYRFPGIPRPREFKDDYRGRLDGAPWSPDEQGRVIDEVLEAYRHNTDVLVELGEVHGSGT
ncbi:biliverdin-producing heme oxygenase [Saccharopolyspora sp. HNM0983]|uniref:Biliverdin-producing heme oxygenase n=2 Tax=Saccharopolyspora montiporae TaxID=2781240 RepID=A0A929G0L4_9PSEU|nr:biliverdin-producing heme oxygenase [Saccharopolyspora sp. HNM0983]